MTEEPITQLRIRQQNLRKSIEAQLDFTNTSTKEYDILCIQEPYIDFQGLTRATSCWRVVKPSQEREGGPRYRALTLVHTRVATEGWERIDVDSPDIVLDCEYVTLLTALSNHGQGP
jgi:hypothetical protein